MTTDRDPLVALSPYLPTPFHQLVLSEEVGIPFVVLHLYVLPSIGFVEDASSPAPGSCNHFAGQFLLRFRRWRVGAFRLGSSRSQRSMRNSIGNIEGCIRGCLGSNQFPPCVLLSGKRNASFDRSGCSWFRLVGECAELRGRVVVKARQFVFRYGNRCLCLQNKSFVIVQI